MTREEVEKDLDVAKARVRELEAELADVRTYGAAAKYKARAEKAEARLSDELVRLGEAVLEIKQLEARVAVLEMEVDFWKTGVETNPIWKRNPAMHSQVYAMLEAIKESREREAD